MNKHIVVVDPGAVLHQGDKFYLPERSYMGYLSYGEYLRKHHPDFNFSVVSIEGAQEVGAGVENLHPFDKQDINFIEEKADSYLELIDSGCTLLSLYRENTKKYINLPHKIVYLLENTPAIRYDMYRFDHEEGRLPFAGLKLKAGLYRNDFFTRRVLSQAAGLQLNGPAAYQRYGGLVDNSILFYDHRVNEIPGLTEKNWDFSGPLRFGFSGRVIKIKGSRYLGGISQKIYQESPRSPFYIMGDGDDLDSVLKTGSPMVSYQGFMPYLTHWEPFVRENVDVMIFPHVQGDPSMTYYESLGQGVPILAFENETSNFLAEQGVGWVVPRGDLERLALLVRRLVRNPEEVREKSEAALRFMDGNLYQKVVERRMEHLISIAQQV